MLKLQADKAVRSEMECGRCLHPKRDHIAVPKPGRDNDTSMVPGWCYTCRYVRSSTNHPCTKWKRRTEPTHNGYHDRRRK